MKKKDLTLKKFQKVSKKRWDEGHAVSLNYLEIGACAAGEVGELCNILKKIKLKRKELNKQTKEDVAYEIADSICYLVNLASQLDIDVEKCIIEKFNIVSDRYNSKAKL